MKKYDKGYYMMATTAIHTLGDISSNDPDMCIVHGEDEDNYYGNWVTGLGFINVRFPKESTRPLNEDEVKRFSGKGVAINNNPPHHIFSEEELREQIPELNEEE